ncbi:hypothetical protein [Vibrio sp. STUT-A11]|uniref:hypothetical protein n=1 Tax=Vibrio sp. STUT-A11 TaxID=2976236 RepID=UPI00222F1045|nr:hypothetical protein [Vibrio sp. STUT-A11]BDR13178.1 hypothetical protein VspSTUT11_11540 [Vibrio sp. STUT-A11]
MAVKFTYPSMLPVPLLSSYSLNQKPGVIATDFSTGRMRTRQLKDRPSTMKATWRIEESMAEMFESALENWLLGRWFLIKIRLPRSERMQEVEALITQDPRENRKPTSNHLTRWDYTGELLIKPLPQMDEGALLDAMYAPSTFAELIAQLETTMTELP